MRKSIRTVTLLVALVCALVFSACGSPVTQQPGTSSPAAYNAFSLQSYGSTVHYDHVPQRVVSFNVHTTENLFALGLADKIVGTSYNNADILPQYRQRFDQIPKLAEKYPSLEVLLAANPDFVYGRSSAFGKEGPASVDAYAEHKIMAYVCKPTYTEGAHMDLVYEDFANLGRIFAIHDRSDAVINDMKRKIADVQGMVKDRPTVRVFVYDSGTDQAYTAGKSLQSDIIRLAGGKNVFEEELSKTWERVNWETVVAKDPDVILINDYGETSLAAKTELLKNHPALKGTRAVRENRFLRIQLPSVFAGIRNADAVEDLAKQMHPEVMG